MKNQISGPTKASGSRTKRRREQPPAFPTAARGHVAPPALRQQQHAVGRVPGQRDVGADRERRDAARVLHVDGHVLTGLDLDGIAQDVAEE